MSDSEAAEMTAQSFPVSPTVCAVRGGLHAGFGGQAPPSLCQAALTWYKVFNGDVMVLNSLSPREALIFCAVTLPVLPLLIDLFS